MSARYVLASQKPKEKPPVELELIDDGVYLVLQAANGPAVARSLLKIDKQDGSISRCLCIEPVFGFQLDAHGRVVIR